MDFIEASFTMVTVYQTAEVRQQKLFHASLQISNTLSIHLFPKPLYFIPMLLYFFPET